jgi:large subunit ribosomal protein L13
MSTSTYLAKPGEVKADWHLVDASDQILGRLAAKVAVLLQGKHKPTYTPHVETGDFVVIVNAEKITVTGNKAEQLEWDTYHRYPTGRKVYTYKTMRSKHPEKLVEVAIRRMLPKSRLGRKMLGKLKIYRGEEHPHSAQQPKEFKVS